MIYKITFSNSSQTLLSNFELVIFDFLIKYSDTDHSLYR